MSSSSHRFLSLFHDASEHIFFLLLESNPNFLYHRIHHTVSPGFLFPSFNHKDYLYDVKTKRDLDDQHETLADARTDSYGAMTGLTTTGKTSDGTETKADYTPAKEGISLDKLENNERSLRFRMR